MKRKTGKEGFCSGDESLGFGLGDFWQWAGSDLLSNTWRGLLAEYLVARVVGDVAGVRLEWDAYDCQTKSGAKIEVKSAAYLQSWKQDKHSQVIFGIAKTKAWNAKTNEYSQETKRQADVYVFCLLKHKDKYTIDPLNLDQWEFYVLDTPTITKTFGDQKSVVLAKISDLTSPCSYSDLEGMIDEKLRSYDT